MHIPGLEHHREQYIGLWIILAAHGGLPTTCSQPKKIKSFGGSWIEITDWNNAVYMCVTLI